MIKGIESDFPVLSQKVNGKKLVYLDNAATTQKPKAVIKSIEKLAKTDTLLYGYSRNYVSK